MTPGGSRLPNDRWGRVRDSDSPPCFAFRFDTLVEVSASRSLGSNFVFMVGAGVTWATTVVRRLIPAGDFAPRASVRLSPGDYKPGYYELGSAHPMILALF
jgi:hypothetical protein